MKFSYPITEIEETKNKTPLESFYTFRKSGGFYPIGVSNMWHGGIHIEGDNKEICAIADGEIIACRILSKSIIEEMGAYYSNGFVLIRHKYEYKAEDDSEKQFVFYSLYNHLLPCKKDGKDADKIFGGKDVPRYLRKTEDGYEVTGDRVYFRSTEKEEKRTRGKEKVKLEKGAFLRKAQLETAEMQATHWTRHESNLKDEFIKVSYRGETGFVSKQFLKDIKGLINEYDDKKFPYDTVKNCKIAIKAGDVIGYTGPCGKIGDSNYTACHVEVFTINESELNEFLSGNVKNENNLRRFFRFDEDVNLQKNYPVKIKGSWEIKLLKSGTGYSKIEIQCKKKKVNYTHLKDLRNNTYSIKDDKYDTVNAIFDKVLSKNSILHWVQTIKDEKGEKTQERIASVKFMQKPSVFWIANDRLIGKTQGDIFELEESNFEKLYDSEKEPDTQELTILSGTVMDGCSQEVKTGSDVWYQLESNRQKGWLKEGTKGYKKLSAYKWKEWGFTNPIKDDPYDFLFDGNEKGAFIKEVAQKIDSNKDGKITADELLAAIKKKTIAPKLAGIICYHASEWAAESIIDPYIAELDKLADKVISNLPLISEKRKKIFEEEKSKLLRRVKLRIGTSGFWNEVSELKNNTEVFYFHPIAFVEQMKRMEGGNCFCQDKGLSSQNCNGKGCNIDDKTYEDTAKILGVEIAVLKAIGKKESKGSGFYSSGQAAILLERHYMYRELKKKGYAEKQLSDLNKTYPKIVNSTSGEYGKYSDQCEKLKTAKTIDYDCAIKSCSWGKFQVMGIHYANLYSNPKELEVAMNMCERQQFEYFIQYLKKTNGLITALKERKWETIALLYNGQNWEKQNPTYAKDIEKYYNEFKK